MLAVIYDNFMKQMEIRKQHLKKLKYDEAIKLNRLKAY